MKYTDINEVNPVTIISNGTYSAARTDNYMAFNADSINIPSQHEFYKHISECGDIEYISKFHLWVREQKIVGYGSSIKEACQDLVKKLNKL